MSMDSFTEAGRAREAAALEQIRIVDEKLAARRAWETESGVESKCYTFNENGSSPAEMEKEYEEYKKKEREKAAAKAKRTEEKEEEAERSSG